MLKTSIKFLSVIINFAIYKTCGVMLEPKFFSRFIKLNLLSSTVFRATHDGDVNKLRQLIAKGVNVNERQRDGFTPLMLSALRGKSSLVELLIENGADVNVRDEIGYPRPTLTSMGGMGVDTLSPTQHPVPGHI